MSRRKLQLFALGKVVAPAIAVIAAISIFTMNGCTPKDQSPEKPETDTSAVPESKEEEVQKAMKGEEASAKKKGDKKVAKRSKKDSEKARKSAAAEKPAKKVEKAVEKTVEHKVEAKVEKLAEHKVPAPSAQPVRRSPASAAGGGMYAVQFAAFKVKENAEKLAAKLKAEGVAVEMASIDHSKNGILHLVRIPPTTSRDEAQKNFEQYNGKLDLKAQVVTISGH